MGLVLGRQAEIKPSIGNISALIGKQWFTGDLGSNAQQLNWMEFLTTSGLPSIPTGLSVTAGGTQVVLNWSISAGATSYNVKCSTTNGGPYVTIASPTTTSYTNTGLVGGTTHYYVVSAVNGVAESTNSIQVSATPANPTIHPPVLAAIPNQTILAGRTLLVPNQASDADLPQQTLTFRAFFIYIDAYWAWWKKPWQCWAEKELRAGAKAE